MNGLLAIARPPGATESEALGAGPGGALGAGPQAGASASALDAGGERASFLTLLELASVSLRQGGGLQLVAAEAAAQAGTRTPEDAGAGDAGSVASWLAAAAPLPESAARGSAAAQAPGATGALDALVRGETGPAGPAVGPTPEGVEVRSPETDAAAALARAASDPAGREPAALAEHAPARAETAPRADARAQAAFAPAPGTSRPDAAEVARGAPSPVEPVANDVARAAEGQNPAPPPDGPGGAAPSSSAETREPGAARELRALPELPARNETEIVREVRMLAQSGGGQARIQLHPPQLGDMSLRVTVTEHAVSVSFVAEHGQIADLLARHLPELRQVLQSAGVRADSLSLDARTASDEAAGDGSGADAWDGGGRAARGGGGPGAAELPEAWPPLPRVAPNSLGMVDLTI